MASSSDIGKSNLCPHYPRVKVVSKEGSG